MQHYHPFDGHSANPYWTRGVRFLVLANIAVFALQILFLLLPRSWGWDRLLSDYFALWPEKVVEHFYVWQLVTNTFLHDVQTLWHLLFNLLTLFFLGHMVENHCGTRRFLFFYFSCAFFASLVFTVFQFISNTRSYCLGASGAVMGVLALAACIYPNRIVYFQLFFPIRLRTIVLIIIGFNLFEALPFHAVSGIAVSAHLGGILYGYLYHKFGDKVGVYFQKIERHMMEQYRQEQRKKHRNTRDEVDRLLDKIAQEGISGLSPREKAFLQKASKEYQGDE